MTTVGDLRRQALERGDKTYHGFTHQCGRTLRYASSGACVWCAHEKPDPRTSHRKLRSGERLARMEPIPAPAPAAEPCVRPFKSGRLPSHMVLADGRPRRLEFGDDGLGRLAGAPGGEGWEHPLVIDVQPDDRQPACVKIVIRLHGVGEVLRLDREQSAGLARHILKAAGATEIRFRWK